MITTWLELVSRLVFSFSMIQCMENAKSLLCMESPKVHAASVISVQSYRKVCTPTSIDTRAPIEFREERSSSRVRSRMVSLSHVLFMVWGLVVITAHFLAAMVSDLPACAIQVRPCYVEYRLRTSIRELQNSKHQWK